jgi:hypothetical protein
MPVASFPSSYVSSDPPRTLQPLKGRSRSVVWIIMAPFLLNEARDHRVQVQFFDFAAQCRRAPQSANETRVSFEHNRKRQLLSAARYYQVESLS